MGFLCEVFAPWENHWRKASAVRCPALMTPSLCQAGATNLWALGPKIATHGWFQKICPSIPSTPRDPKSPQIIRIIIPNIPKSYQLHPYKSLPGDWMKLQHVGATIILQETEAPNLPMGPGTGQAEQLRCPKGGRVGIYLGYIEEVLQIFSGVFHFLDTHCGPCLKVFFPYFLGT